MQDNLVAQMIRHADGDPAAIAAQVEAIRRARHGSVPRNAVSGRLRSFSSSVVLLSPSSSRAALGVTHIRPARRGPGDISSGASWRASIHPWG